VTYGSEIWISDFKLKFETLDKSFSKKLKTWFLKIYLEFMAGLQIWLKDVNWELVQWY
jgi:hypothetical protein